MSLSLLWRSQAKHQREQERQFLLKAWEGRVPFTRRGCAGAAVQQSNLAVIPPGSDYWGINNRANGPLLPDTMCKAVYSLC